jgi:hypothetical protein
MQFKNARKKPKEMRKYEGVAKTEQKEKNLHREKI